MNALMWAIALQILGVVLLMAEIFLPSGGLLAIATAAAVIGSLVVGFDSSPMEGWILLGLDLVLFPYLIWWGIGKIKNSPMGLSQSLESGGSGEAGLVELVGQVGRAETDLRPVGRVRIGDRLHDAQAKSGFVTSGTEVEVVSAEGNHLVVKSK